MRRTTILSPVATFGVAVLLPAVLHGHQTPVVYAEAPIAVITDGSIAPGRVASISTRAMQTMEGRLGIHLHRSDLTVRLCQGDAEYQKAGGLGNTDACYLAPSRIVIRGHDGLQGDLAHEYAHVLIEERTRGRCPAWLEEGIVNHENHVTETGQYDPKTMGRLNAALLAVVRGRSDWSVEGLARAAQRTHMMSDAFYGASWSATDYMYRVYGRQRVLRAVAEMGPNDPDEACKSNLGRGLSEIEQDWRATVQSGA